MCLKSTEQQRDGDVIHQSSAVVVDFKPLFSYLELFFFLAENFSYP